MDEIEKIDLEGYQLCHCNPAGILREHRVILGLTQQAVADRAGIPLQSYQVFESGKRKLKNASFTIACKVLEALEMDITKYFHGEYAIGEEVYLEKDGLHYKKTGKRISEDVET